MKKNYDWRMRAFFNKLVGGLGTLILIMGLSGSLQAQVECIIDNNSGGITAGTLSLFADSGNGVAALFNPAGIGDADDPGCGAFEPYTYNIDSVIVTMADASLFGLPDEGLGEFSYSVSILGVEMDTCTFPGAELWNSGTMVEVMNDEGYHTIVLPVDLEVTGKFYVRVTAVNWTGAPDRSPSAVLWDNLARPECRQWVYVDNGATMVAHENAFSDPFNLGWFTISVAGTATFVDPCDGAILCDNFDSYTAGDSLALVSDGLWSTWSSAPGSAEDALVSDEMALSAPNSVVLENTTTDLVLPLGDKTTGTYELDMAMYFPSGQGGYFNLMHQFDNVNNAFEWALEVFFNGDGTGYTSAAGAEVDFTYTEDMWLDVAAIIDLDSDIAQLWIGTEKVREWKWSLEAASGDPGINQLAVADFFPAAVAGAKFFVDDVMFDEADPLGCGFPAIICDDIDDYSANDYIALQSNGLWTTWSDDPGSAEDAMVVDSMSYSMPNAILLQESTTDLVLPLGDLTTGAYEVGMKMYFPAGFGGYYNLMHVFDNVNNEFEWGLEVFFNGDGTGTANAGGTEVGFNYPEDFWMDVYCIIDLDNDLASLYVNGNNVTVWQWSLNAGNGNDGVNQLAVMDLFPAAVDAPQFYVDDVYLKETANLLCDFPTIICDNIDSYSEGPIGPQSPYWSTWSGNEGGAEDGIVTTDQAATPPNSMYIGNTGQQDVLLLLGNQSDGSYTLEFDVYVEPGATGYYNIQEDEVPAVAWNLNVFFNRDGNDPGVGSFEVTNSEPDVTFEYPEGEWFHVKMNIDLDNPNMWFYVNDQVVFDNYVYPGNIGAVDFFSIDNMSQMYIDNVVFYYNPAVSVTELADLKDFSLYPNPNNGTFTITSAEFSGAYVVEMIDLTGRIVYQEKVTLNQNENNVINTSGLQTGVYLLRMISNENGEVFSTRVSIK